MMPPFMTCRMSLNKLHATIYNVILSSDLQANLVSGQVACVNIKVSAMKRGRSTLIIMSTKVNSNKFY